MKARTPSATTIIAVLALVLALGGTAVASGYLITSLGQIKPSVRQALKGNRGPRGFAGPRGLQGLQGPQGNPGLLGLTTVDGAVLTYPPGGFGAPPDANCPAGEYVVGTGFNGPFNAVGGFVQAYGTFVGGFFENGSSIPIEGNVQAICARVPPGATVSSVRSLSSARSRYAADVRRAIARVRESRR